MVCGHRVPGLATMDSDHPPEANDLSDERQAKESEKERYEPPRLEVVGRFEPLTLGCVPGSHAFNRAAETRSEDARRAAEKKPPACED